MTEKRRRGAVSWRRRWPWLAAASLLIPPVAACAAPQAKVAQGPVADAVRQGIASGRGGFEHSGWAELLARHVDGAGRVDYAGFARDRAGLDDYLARLAEVELASLSRDELLAVLINAYNACTVRVILDGAREGRFPASIRDLSDPWGQPSCTLGGHRLSLDTIEHGLLRPLFQDPRIHAAVNCASRSCPVLVPWAYRADAIEAQLAERIRAMVGDPQHVRVEDGRLRLSRIFDWYGSDFVDGGFRGSAGSVAEYVARHAGSELRRRIESLGPRPRVDYLDYDWSLNGR